MSEALKRDGRKVLGTFQCLMRYYHIEGPNEGLSLEEEGGNSSPSNIGVLSL